jgi:integrase/recombinase XerD
MSDLNDFKEKYRQHLTILNYAPGTIKGHLFFLNRFINYLAEINITEIAAVTRDVVQDYQTHLYETINNRGEPNSVFHQNNNMKAVKAFFRFLKENDYLAGDPAKEISYAKTPKRLPRSILSGPEAKKVIHAPNTKTALGYRDRTILEVLYSTGIRNQELINITLNDVDYTEGFIRINSGKGNKDRVVPIGKIACRYIENYVKAVRPMLIKNPTNNHLFITIKGNTLAHTVPGQAIRRSNRRAKIKKNITPHTFRHTCATLMLRNKANIRHIQELLGHATLGSTQVYTSVTITDLKEVHSKCHPREKDRE